MEKFAFLHLFADIAIMIGVITIIIYASIHLGDEPSQFANDIEMINPKTFLSFIGLAAYTFEGIGIIIPVMETTNRPDLYPKILTFVISLLTVFYIFFGNYTYFVYGKTTLSADPLITQILPRGQIPVTAVKVIWIINLIFTYPLVIHPANMVIESYIFKGWKKSPKRKWSKNVTRTLLVAFTVVLSVALMDTLDKLESINGAFACIPLAFLLPSIFHYKLAAETKREKIIDLVIAAISLVLQIVCTIITFVFWND
jgi:solute carrier family 36 (proton-coupled amino acid transporter)